MFPLQVVFCCREIHEHFSALVIFGNRAKNQKMTFFFHEMKRNGMTSFMDFMLLCYISGKGMHRTWVFLKKVSKHAERAVLR